MNFDGVKHTRPRGPTGLVECIFGLMRLILITGLVVTLVTLEAPNTLVFGKSLALSPYRPVSPDRVVRLKRISSSWNR